MDPSVFALALRRAVFIDHIMSLERARLLAEAIGIPPYAIEQSAS